MGTRIAPCLELPPRHLDGPQVWKLTYDTYRHLSARRHSATLEEYRATAVTPPTPHALTRRAYHL
jgi:hypothetical protein